jgi:hypothetical protein
VECGLDDFWILISDIGICWLILSAVWTCKSALPVDLFWFINIFSYICYFFEKDISGKCISTYIILGQCSTLLGMFNAIHRDRANIYNLLTKCFININILLYVTVQLKDLIRWCGNKFKWMDPHHDESEADGLEKNMYYDVFSLFSNLFSLFLTES